MRSNNPTILITREIDKSLLNEITSKGISADIIPFIRTEIIKTKKVQTQIEDVLNLRTTVVFTSMNAIEAVSEHLQNKKPGWSIYCIGNTTRKLIEDIFGKEYIVAAANNATALAKKIIANKESISEVYFFCGDKKRNELPDLLKSNNIAVNEIEVYTTTILQHIVEKDYDAILFFSPSTVNGFFKNNAVTEKTALFAIGDTTAAEIKKNTENKIIISNKPGKRHLVEKTIEYFTCLF